MLETSVQKSYSRYFLFLFYAILALYPFYDLISAVTNVNVISYTKDIVFTCLFIISLFSLIKAGKIKLNALDYLLYGYICMVVINLIRSPVPFRGIVDSLRYRLLFLAGTNLFFKYLALKEIDLKIVFSTIMKIVFFSGILVSLIAVVEYFSPETINSIYGESLTKHLTVIIGNERYRRFISTFRNPINLGYYMILASVAGLYLLSEYKNINKVYISMALCLFLFTLLNTYSRGAYFALLCVYIGWYLAFMYSSLRIRKMTIKAASVCSLLLIAVSVFVLTSVDSPYVDRLKRATPQQLMANERVERLSDTPSASKTENISNINERVIAGQSTLEAEKIDPSGDEDDNVVQIIDTEQGATVSQKDDERGFDSLMFKIFGHGIGERIGSSLQYVFEIGYLSIYYESGLIALLCFIGFILLGMYKHLVRFLICLKDKQIDYLALSSIAILGSFLVTMIAEDTYMQMPYSLYYPIFVMFSESLGEGALGKKEKLNG